MISVLPNELSALNFLYGMDVLALPKIIFCQCIKENFIVKLSLIFKKRDLWKIYLFKIKKNENIFNCNLKKAIKIIGENGIRLTKNFYHTTADPFLFEENGKLYIFYEMKSDFSKGFICAESFDGNTWKNYGCVLKDEFHISYPQIFRFNNKIFMMPETEEDGKVWLYESVTFPSQWKKNRVLISNKLVDTNLLINDVGIFLLGTHKLDGLCVYHASSFEEEFNSTYIEKTNHAMSSRNAGAILKFQEKYFRVFQDCSRFYGEKIGISEILAIDKYSYFENIINFNFLENRILIKNCIGHHHISELNYNNDVYIAVDILKKDLYINTFIFAVFRFLILLKKCNEKFKIKFRR